MTNEFEKVRLKFKGSVEFELMLGGINPHGTQFLGDYGRRFLMRLWQDVEATTGQSFGYKLPEQYVHNSVNSCLALEAARELSGQSPFELLAEMQRRFFVEGADITSTDVLLKIARQFEFDEQELKARMSVPSVLERVRFQFDHAQSFGTQALPNMLYEDQEGVLRLLAGGYVDAQMMASLLEQQ